VVAHVLVLNPNSSVACTEGIRASLAAFAGAGPGFVVEGLVDGPAAVATWGDWFAAAGPLLRRVEAAEAGGAEAGGPPLAYVVACASDPAVDLLRSVTPRPVFGALRSGIAAAMARADRFGIVAFVGASVARHRRVLQAMGLEHRCAASLPLNLGMDSLTHPDACRPRLLEVASTLKAAGAEAVVLGCAGMAGHRRYLEDAAGLPVIEPVQAAAVQALLGWEA